MGLLIKNKVASVEEVAHLSISRAGRVAKRCTQSLRNAGVPRAKSLLHINLVAEGRSLKGSLKHRVETARRPSGSIPLKLTPQTTASTANNSCPIHCHRLLAFAQSWLDFEQARCDFCHDLVQSFSGCSLASSLLQRSSNLANSVSLPSISSRHLSYQAPFATPLTSQTTIASTVAAKPRSPECSDEELQREPDNFSFHFSQDEEWTPEVESRMQDTIDRMLEDGARRQLAVPFPNFSVHFPDDLLVDSVASSLGDYNTYSVDQEDKTEGGDRTSVEEQDDAESMVEDIRYGIDNAQAELATYVLARLLTPISEESLADEFTIKEDAHSPPLSFKRGISPSSTHSDMTEVGATPASTYLDMWVSLAATAGKTLGRARQFVYLKITLSIETLCETISFHEEDCQDRDIRRVPGCIDQGRVLVDQMFTLRPLLASPWHRSVHFRASVAVPALRNGNVCQIWMKAPKSRLRLRVPPSHQLHQSPLMPTYGRGDDDGSLLTPTYDGGDDDGSQRER